MNGYIRNRDCPCLRCRSHSLMGAAVLITLGFIFLLDRFHFGRGGHLAPILLLVIGCMLLIQRTGSTEGHINPGWQAGQIPPPPQNPQQWTAGPGPAAPQNPQQWTSSDSSTPPPPPDSNDPQVKP